MVHETALHARCIGVVGSMKPIQMIVLGVAMVATLGLVMVARSMMAAEPVVQHVVDDRPRIPMTDVLVANEAIPQGSSLQASRLAWEQWPQTSVRQSYITRAQTPDAIKEYADRIARSSLFEGEPVIRNKLVDSESGYLSAILPPGKRAVSVRVQAETSAGGFILPNDYVDVIMGRKDNNDQWLTDTVLANVRVLAIDQLVEEKDGEKFKVGDTATLELSAEQAEILTVSKLISNNELTLALRSVADSNPALTNQAGHLLKGSAKEEPTSRKIKIIRFGRTEEVQTKTRKK